MMYFYNYAKSAVIKMLELKEKISANQNSSQDSRAQAALVDGRLSKLADCNESMKHERKHVLPHTLQMLLNYRVFPCPSMIGSVLGSLNFVVTPGAVRSST